MNTVLYGILRFCICIYMLAFHKLFHRIEGMEEYKNFKLVLEHEWSVSVKKDFNKSVKKNDSGKNWGTVKMYK